MPGRTGYDICQYVKMNPRHRHVRVVLTAGVMEPIDEAHAQQVEADASIKKPFEATALVLVIEAALFGGAGRAGRAPRRRRGERVADKRGQPLAGGDPVAQLRPVLRCRDRDGPVDQARGESREQSRALLVGEYC